MNNISIRHRSKALPIANSIRQWNQISFLLKRFNFTSQQFAEEINYLLTNSPTFNSAQFTAKLLAKCQQLLIIDSWNLEPHYLTNNYQVAGAKRLLRILDLNEFLELNTKLRHPTYDPDPYYLTCQQATRQLQKLTAQARNPLQSLRSLTREPTDLPPTTTSFPHLGGDFHYLPY
jgi:hypothetical protein